MVMETIRHQSLRAVKSILSFIFRRLAAFFSKGGFPRSRKIYAPKLNIGDI